MPPQVATPPPPKISTPIHEAPPNLDIESLLEPLLSEKPKRRPLESSADTGFNKQPIRPDCDGCREPIEDVSTSIDVSSVSRTERNETRCTNPSFFSHHPVFCKLPLFFHIDSIHSFSDCFMSSFYIKDYFDLT